MQVASGMDIQGCHSLLRVIYVYGNLTLKVNSYLPIRVDNFDIIIFCCDFGMTF